MIARTLGSLTVVALLAARPAAQVYEYTIDTAGSTLVMSGDVFQQIFTCSGFPIDPAPVPLGPLQACPSGATQIPLSLSGTLKLAIRRDPRSGQYVARFAGGNLQAPAFTGIVGTCATPDATVQVTGLRFNVGSEFLPISLSGPPVGCTPTDNLAGSIRMHVLEGDSVITVGSAMDTLPLDCKSSSPTPMCGRLDRRTFEIVIGGASPLVFPYSYTSACVPPIFGPKVVLSGTLRFSGTLRGHMTGILVGPLRDPNPGCN